MVQHDDPLTELRSSNGQTLDELSAERPQLVVFLRHLGCTFCRESLSDLSEQRAEIEGQGYGIVLVHMVDDERANDFFSNYGLESLPRISDTDRRLYQMFGLDAGGVRELFGVRVWVRGFVAGLLSGHGIGRVQGNPFQMPGVYVVDHGNILTGFQHNQASDRPNYCSLIAQANRTIGVDRSSTVASNCAVQPAPSL